jgi:hypothetical protein
VQHVSGTLSCTGGGATYPVIKVYANRNSEPIDLADFTNIGNGSAWTAPLNFIALDQGGVLDDAWNIRPDVGRQGVRKRHGESLRV